MRWRVAFALAAAIVLGACSSGGSGRAAGTPRPRRAATTPRSTSTSTAAPGATAPSSPASPPPTAACTIGAQSPPTGTLDAAMPTALAFAPDGRLFFAERAGTVRVYQDGAVTNNGPSGDSGSPSTGYDTVVAAVARGGGYQWANCYGYSHLLGSSTSCGAGQHEPDWSSEASTVVPTGAAFVDGSGPAGLAGHLVVCTYEAGMLILRPGSPHATVDNGPAGCRLDVTQGPDHAVYFADQSHIYRSG